MEKKTNHKLVTRQNKNPEPIDKTEEQNPGEDGRMRRSAENGDSIYDPDGSAVKPGKEGTYQYLRATMRCQESEGSQEFVTAPGGGAQAALPAAGQKEADFADSELRE